MIRIRDVSKSYGSTRALSQLSLNFKEGVYGLLGNNGAGKTTLLNILATVHGFDHGSVEVFGHDLKKEPGAVRALLGYLPQDFHFFAGVSVDFAMDYFAELKGLPPSAKWREEKETLLEQVGLTAHRRKKIKELSGGMKQRLGIAQALIGNPKLLIVDEPTVGLDPEERIRFRQLINRFSAGRVILLSTHIVSDIASTCEEVALIRSGHALFQGKIDDLLLRTEGKVWEAEVTLDQIESLATRVKLVTIIRKRGLIQARFLSESAPEDVNELTPAVPTLEDAYLYYNSLEEPTHA
ncbi:ATP-binding cassette domain-containing protein [Paenibacillus turpanensis]|uniref:ATP-binding cassette domain-containing protein n=1 Tax=Paenibacillus turpanensis TaxID=2689078 RepID=UPI001408DA0F|nr:ATP-binding cassette domain-containing protein [Paenibacillus turpanensis]